MPPVPPIVPDLRPSASPVAVTGATGAIGGRVAASLSSAGVPTRLLVRDASRAPDLPGTEVAVCTYADTGAVVEALQGVEVLLMVSAAESADRLEQHLRFVDAAVDAGVRHVVYTSFYGAAPEATFTLARDHWATEEHLRALVPAGVHHTFLRDNLYLDFLPGLVGDDGVIRGPAGEGRVAAVTRDDVAAACTAVLRAPHEHRDVTYDLTGPEALSMGEIAAVLTDHLGREVRYHDETLEEAYASRRRWPAPDWQYDAWVSTYTAIAAGEMAGVTDHVQRLTGRPATGLAAFLRAP